MAQFKDPTPKHLPTVDALLTMSASNETRDSLKSKLFYSQVLTDVNFTVETSELKLGWVGLNNVIHLKE